MALNHTAGASKAERQKDKKIFDNSGEPEDSAENPIITKGGGSEGKNSDRSEKGKPTTIDLTPPRIFSLVRNTEKSIKFLNELEEKLEAYDEVVIDFTDISYVSSDGLFGLHSKVVDGRGQAMGIFPKGEELYNKFRASDFFGDGEEATKGSKRSQGKMGRQTKKAKSFTIDKDVSSYKTGLEISLDEVDETLEFIASSIYNGKRLPPIRTIFVALMENTVEHASGDLANEYWRYSYYHDKEKESVRFNFLDYGMGITESVKLRWRNEKSGRFSRSSGDKILKAAFAGKVTISTPEKPRGGRGLPSILDTCKRNRIKNLV